LKPAGKTGYGKISPVGAAQIEVEVANFLKMMSETYAILGLEYEMALSTRPEGYLGELEMWNKAEAALQVRFCRYRFSLPVTWDTGG
jgi:threonyl-tRNA synthetase